MESHPCLCGTVVELDIQRRHVSLKGEPWGCLLSAECIVDGAVLVSYGELSPNFDILVLWQVLWNPSREAMRVAVVAALRLIPGAVEVAEEVPCQIVSTVAQFSQMIYTLLTSLRQDCLDGHPCPRALSHRPSSLRNICHLCADARLGQQNSSSPTPVVCRQY